MMKRTAVDVLNKLPSVSVSPDGEVLVRGTTDFMFYLNGRSTQMDPALLLGQISGNAIENIEVITVPTAKYDAQGKGGIINITTRTSGIGGLSVSTNLMGGGARILDTTNNAYKHMVASGEQIFYQDKLYTRMVPIAEIDISYAFNTNGKSTRKVGSFGKSEFYAPSAGYDFE